MDLILASKSPRRKEILENLGVKFQILTLETDESTNEPCPQKYVEELARRKGDAVRQLMLSNGSMTDDTVILACDTVVVSPDGEIMGKPCDEADARRMLLSFSGKSHRVISGIALLSKSTCVTASETTFVFFDSVSEKDVEFYVSTPEPYDKAGAYAIQGYASLWINKIDGDYFNVVGLPVKRVSDTLKTTFGLTLSDFL